MLHFVTMLVTSVVQGWPGSLCPQRFRDFVFDDMRFSLSHNKRYCRFSCCTMIHLILGRYYVILLLHDGDVVESWCSERRHLPCWHLLCSETRLIDDDFETRVCDFDLYVSLLTQR